MHRRSASSAMLRAATVGLFLAGALAACDRAEPPSASTTTDAPAADAPGDGDAMVTMRYACDGQRVAVFGNDHATVTLDGRDIELAHVSGSSPPRFSGEGLEFSVAADGAMLAQDGGSNRACTAE